MYLLEPRRDNSAPRSEWFDVRPFREFQNVLGELFGSEGPAALRLDIYGTDAQVPGRTLALSDHGSYGQLIPAMRPEEAIGYGNRALLANLSFSPRGDDSQPVTGFRTNIGLLNLSGQSATLVMDLADETSGWLGQIPVTLERFGFLQLTDVFARLTDRPVLHGFAVVESQSEGTAFLAYASVVDNRNGDAVFVPAARLGSRVFVPAP